MMADCKILFAKWSLFSYMEVNFIQAAVQRCPYSNFQVTGRLEFLLFIGGSEGVRSPPQAVQWEIQPMQNMWVVEHCIMSLSLTPFWPRAWGSSYKWSHAVFVFVSGLFHLMWSALGSYMFVRLDSVLLCLCIIVSLCIHPIDGILGWCPVLVTINSVSWSPCLWSSLTWLILLIHPPPHHLQPFGQSWSPLYTAVAKPGVCWH